MTKQEQLFREPGHQNFFTRIANTLLLFMIAVMPLKMASMVQV